MPSRRSPSLAPLHRLQRIELCRDIPCDHHAKVFGGLVAMGRGRSAGPAGAISARNRPFAQLPTSPRHLLEPPRWRNPRAARIAFSSSPLSSRFRARQVLASQAGDETAIVLPPTSPSIAHRFEIEPALAALDQRQAVTFCAPRNPSRRSRPAVKGFFHRPARTAGDNSHSRNWLGMVLLRGPRRTPSIAASLKRRAIAGQQSRINTRPMPDREICT